MAAFADRLGCRLQGRWAQLSGGVALAAGQDTARLLHARDAEPVRVVDHRTGRIVFHSSRRRRR
jgi:hypothetical protein